MQARGPTKVKGTTQIKKPSEVNIQHGGARELIPSVECSIYTSASVSPDPVVCFYG